MTTNPALHPNSTATPPIIVVRHGINSEAMVFEPFSQFLFAATKIAVNNESYDWKRSVLYNGVELASFLLQKCPGRSVILIGHSMGGLIARIANAALAMKQEFVKTTLSEAKYLGYGQQDLKRIADFDKELSAAAFPSVLGLITLATPNSGAMSSSQVGSLSNIAAILGGPTPSNLVKTAQGVVRLVHRGLNMRWDSVQDLTSDRLYRLFQYFKVECPIYSISGSKGNRLNSSSAFGSVVKLAGINVTKPHDEVVEDISVDLNQSVLPHEFKANRCFHSRVYQDCIDVHHCNIYDTLMVRAQVVYSIAELLGGPITAPG